eukprot:2726770-Amphidinium_carterae.1
MSCCTSNSGTSKFSSESAGQHALNLTSKGDGETDMRTTQLELELGVRFLAEYQQSWVLGN